MFYISTVMHGSVGPFFTAVQAAEFAEENGLAFSSLQLVRLKSPDALVAERQKFAVGSNP